MGIDSEPPRFPKYLPDGTWTLMVLGKSSSAARQMGDKKRRTLIRDDDNGEVRRSEIVKLSDSEMTLRTWGQIDRYRRLKESAAITIPATEEREADRAPSPPMQPKKECPTRRLDNRRLLTQNGVLLFRADKPVQGNTGDNVVLLGTAKELTKTMLPMYLRAAEKHVRLRLRDLGP